MKRIFIIAILITVCGLSAMAQNRPDMTHQSTGRDRDELPSYSAALELQFNDEGLIEVLGCENEYYNVTITRETAYVWNGIIGKEYGNVIAYNGFETTATYLITLTSSRGTTSLWRLEYGILTGSRVPNWGGVIDQRKNGFYLSF